MPIINSIAAMAPQMAQWRQHIHQNPELGLDCHETAEFVVAQLRSFGITEIHTGIATSGIVALIEGQGPGRTIGLRADMDALPIHEESAAEYASVREGLAHSCGHDGHTAMLLGAAKYLAETRNFSGRVALIFQPAEEGLGGGRIMVEEGIMDRFGIEEVFGMHNEPGMPVGHFATRPGPLMGGVCNFFIRVTGKGGHAAEPHYTADPLVAAASLVQALQTIVSRNISTHELLVVSVTQFHTGSATNIVPDEAELSGTMRYFDPKVVQQARTRMQDMVSLHAQSYGVQAEVAFVDGYPPTCNHADQARFAAEIARDIVGDDAVDGDCTPIMAAEDFAYMLNARPGAYLFLGQGDTPVCHHPAYDFNDEIAPVGASFFARLVERALPL